MEPGLMVRIKHEVEDDYPKSTNSYRLTRQRFVFSKLGSLVAEKTEERRFLFHKVGSLVDDGAACIDNIRVLPIVPHSGGDVIDHDMLKLELTKFCYSQPVKCEQDADDIVRNKAVVNNPPDLLPRPTLLFVNNHYNSSIDKGMNKDVSPDVYTNSNEDILSQINASCRDGTNPVVIETITANDSMNLPNFNEKTVKNKNESHTLHSQAGQRPYLCLQCNRCFKHADSLACHTRTHDTHDGIDPYTCPICNKIFMQVSYLSKHMRIHKGELPYSCRHCAHAFKTISALARHCKTHTTGKSHMCKECGCGFTQSSNLTLHMRTHTSARPYIYTCKVCNKIFKQESNLAAHLTMHNSGHP